MGTLQLAASAGHERGFLGKRERLGSWKPTTEFPEGCVATGGPDAQKSGKAKAHPGHGLWRLLPQQLWDGQKPH
jgi:hypothetical protein